MIAFLNADCTLRQKADIVTLIEREGLRVHVDRIEGTEIIGVVGKDPGRLAAVIAAMPGVREVRRMSLPYALVSLDYHPERTVVKVGRARFGGGKPVVIAGPCAVESEAQIQRTARIVAERGALMLRGGAFKPRTSPYSFQGLGAEGLRLLADAGKATGLPVVTEVVDSDDVGLVAEHADMLQVGARNMQNFSLLRAVGRQARPVLLKRGMMATIEEFLLAAEYVLEGGNPLVVLCERGIRTFERATRNTLDIAAIPYLKERTHLPVIADPSHACGVRSLVIPLARAAIAAGADGLIVEVHPRPEEALSDGPQALRPDDFARMMAEIGLGGPRPEA
ncbi:MAG: 3-deoxy-7-phosphoheptulonate synthase [Planctomycetota bacterium]